MIHTVSIQATNAPAVLERVLRVTRYRGFDLKSMAMNPAEDNLLDIELQVDCQRPVEQLTKQIDKLYDIRHVAISEHTALSYSA